MEKKFIKPFSDNEKALAVAIISRKLDVLEAKRPDHFTKKEMWDLVASEFNISQDLDRKVTPKRLKRFWGNMKSKVRSIADLRELTETERKALIALSSLPGTIDGEGDDSMARSPDQDSDMDEDLDAWIAKKRRVSTPIDFYYHEENKDRKIQSENIDSPDTLTINVPIPESTEKITVTPAIESCQEPKQTRKRVRRRNADITFEKLKISMKQQLLDHNQHKFDLFIEQQKELHELEVDFRRKKYEIILTKMRECALGNQMFE